MRTLVNSDVPEQDIVVLSPYRAQCFEIGETLKKHGLKSIAISSVVASQGMFIWTGCRRRRGDLSCKQL